MKVLKRLLITAAILAVPLLVKAEGPYESMSRDKTMVVHSTRTIAVGTGVAFTTHSILVDLSSVTTFNHDETGVIHISRIELYVDKLAASTGTVKVGVVNNVNIATGSVTFFGRLSFEKNVSNTQPTLVVNIEESLVRTDAVAPAPGGANVGATPFIYSNDNLNESTLFQTDINLPTPNGNIPPGLGDIILYAANNDVTNTINVIATIYYHTHQR
jgi:hypothetical protein